MFALRIAALIVLLIVAGVAVYVLLAMLKEDRTK
jgi:hypothetical protein